MRARPPRRAVGALCVLLAAWLVAGIALAGCSLPGLSSGSTEPNLAAATSKAISQLQAILGLPMGTITRSSGQPMLPDSEAALTWSGGRADVDAQTGLISCVLLEPKETAASTALSNAVLDKEADRIVGLLGWDAMALAAQGFTPGRSRSVDRGTAGSVYQKTWVGHDEEGIVNQGLIEVGIDKATGELRSFLFSPGPRAAAAVPQKVTKNEAVEIATEAAVRGPSGAATTSSTRAGRDYHQHPAGRDHQYTGRRDHHHDPSIPAESGERDSRAHRRARHHRRWRCIGLDRQTLEEHARRQDNRDRLCRRGHGGSPERHDRIEPAPQARCPGYRTAALTGDTSRRQNGTAWY